MKVITGAAGFIGSCLLGLLNEKGIEDILIVDDFSKTNKLPNYKHKKYKMAIERNEFLNWFQQNAASVEIVYHIGARTDTTEFDMSIFDDLNIHYTQEIWKTCAKNSIPLIYASSAATYGLGEFGYEDNHEIVSKLKPLNPYGDSKNLFDIWALAQKEQPPFWYGLKFFNVYGPNEYHKARMASVIFHSFNQIQEKGFVKLFRSHRPDFADGQQSRDFIYVKDLLNVIEFLAENKPQSGLYNLGTGKARSFYDLAKNTFLAQGLDPKIDFIDTPIDIRDKYQYFTEANMSKLKNAGYTKDFYSLEDGINDYVKNYLMKKAYF